MTNKKNKRNKKVFILLTALLIAAGLSVYIYLKNGKELETQGQISPVNTINYSAPNDQDKAESSRNKDEIIQNMDKPADINQSSGTPISISITRASRTNVNTYIENLAEGTCNLSVTQAGIEKISMSAKIISQASYSTCEGFSLDSNKLDSAPFKVNISVTNGDRVGSASQEVN